VTSGTLRKLTRSDEALRNLMAALAQAAFGRLVSRDWPDLGRAVGGKS
jgi:hypothetical protein